MIRTVLAGEQGLPAQHLGQYAANAPHVNSLGIFLEGQHDLRRTIPASRHVFRHEAGVVVSGRGRARQTEVTDLEVAVGIEKQVRRLQVTVKHVGRVHRLEGAQGLVDKVLAVVIGQILCSNDAVHVGLHQLLNQIDLVESLIIAGSLDVQDRDNILVVEVSQQLHLAQRAQAEHRVVERGDLLDGDFLARRLVDCRAEDRQHIVPPKLQGVVYQTTPYAPSPITS